MNEKLEKLQEELEKTAGQTVAGYTAESPAQKTSAGEQVGAIFRTVARPIISIICICIIAQVVTQQIPISDVRWGMLITPPLWWFMERTVKKGK